MEPENTAVKSTSRLNQVTPLSKYLAMVLFIAMPFIGGWIGYQYAMGEAALEMRDENLFNKNDFVNIEKGTTLKVENDSFDKNSKTKNFITDDISWDFTAELIDNELHWKSSGEKVDKVIKIDDPASLRYVGYGLFQDSKKAYSIGYITQHHDGEKSVSLDGNQLLTALGTVSSSSYLINGTRVFALVSEMSLPWLELVERADAKTFEALNSNYAKDNNSVYYFADKLSNADPANFSIKTLGFFRFGVSGEKIYWKGHLLEGLNGSKLSAELGGSVLTDGSTYYYQTGGCHLVNFSKGTAEELLKYKPPC